MWGYAQRHISCQPYHVNLCMLSYSIEQKVDDYLATNIPGEVMSNEERAAAYRRAIEV